MFTLFAACSTKKQTNKQTNKQTKKRRINPREALQKKTILTTTNIKKTLNATGNTL
jgi:hypothetical protein